MEIPASSVSAEFLAQRRRIGADRKDEVWDGVLHMTPAPSFEHQRIVDDLVVFLVPLVKRTRRGTLRSGVNVCGAPTGWHNFRVPDLTFVAAGREEIIAQDGVRFGGPDAVIEVRSPGDETYEKLPFFASLRIGDVIVIDRDSKRVEIFRLVDADYRLLSADAEGWLRSERLGVRFKGTEALNLLVQDLREPQQATEI